MAPPPPVWAWYHDSPTLLDSLFFKLFFWGWQLFRSQFRESELRASGLMGGAIAWAEGANRLRFLIPSLSWGNALGKVGSVVSALCKSGWFWILIDMGKFMPAFWPKPRHCCHPKHWCLTGIFQIYAKKQGINDVRPFLLKLWELFEIACDKEIRECMYFYLSMEKYVTLFCVYFNINIY